MNIMLNKKDLLKDVEEKYIPMLKEVNIPDFTKCIAQFSGLHIGEVADDIIKEYLLTWAKNKYRFYKMLGDKIKVDNNITYKDENVNVDTAMRDLEIEFPIYALWLEGFRDAENNKLRERDVEYSTRNAIKRLFPECRLEGCLITHFFKSYLKAPDELVTKIGKIWEHQTIEGSYTISIDPVDMMLASENPYDWVSCYRLEVYNDSSHADGCLAAILDDSSLITYVWNREGKFSLYDRYEFKNIRYYRMRQWISISPNETAIHFNDIYPGKNYSNDFNKMLRVIVENLVNEEVIWQHNEGYNTNCHRAEPYGYGEFHAGNIYKIKDAEDEIWEVYTESILCPCGCGGYLPGTDGAEDDCGNQYEYNGDGFVAENFYIEESEEEWCDYLDDYCDRSCNDCEQCPYYNRHNAVCELDEDEECEAHNEAEDNGDFDPYESNIVHCGDHCKDCPLYEKHHKKEEKNVAKTYTDCANISNRGDKIKTIIDNGGLELFSISSKLAINNAYQPLYSKQTILDNIIHLEPPQTIE